MGHFHSFLQDGPIQQELAQQMGRPVRYGGEFGQRCLLSRRLIERGDPCDVITLSEWLDTQGQLDDIGGLAYLGTLAKDTPEAPLRAAGFALGVSNWLRAIPALETAGRIPLVDGTSSGVRALAEEALDQLGTARRARATIPTQARPVMLCLWQAGAILSLARKSPERVAAGALALSPLRSKLVLMTRAMSGFW